MEDGSAGQHRARDGTVAIPPLALPTGWQAVRIAENGEPLVALGALAPGRLAVAAAYHQQEIAGAAATQYAREGVARRLVAAAEALPAGWQLVVLDAWRPLAVQRALYDGWRARLRAEQPALDAEALEALTRRYVSRPSADPARPSPHATGGAVDVTLRDPAGRLAAMGTAFDAFESASHMRWYEERLAAGRLAPDEPAPLVHRRLLWHAMTAVGFTNYAVEWWHFDFGDQFWSCLTGQPARYGLAAPPEYGGKPA